MGRLERKLDTDLIAKLHSGWRSSPKPDHTAVLAPRRSDSYRGALRNAVLRGDIRSTWQGIEPTRRAYHPPYRANRSTKWEP